MHRNSALLFSRYATPYFSDGLRVLELGPDSDPSTYRRQLPDLDLDWETADLADSLMPEDGWFRPAAGEATYLMQSEYAIPVAGDTFDVVVAGNVIEHVRRPWLWVPELARVVKAGGKVILICPISWPHHPAPYDCWRIYPDGMRALCEDAGLDVLLARFETLEEAPSRRRYHGVGYDWINPGIKTSRAKEKIKALIGWPVPTALDLVAIAEKRS
jgi:SAM-dependent methyltransferase